MLKIVRGRSFSFDATIYDTYVAEGNPGNVPTNHTGWTIRSQIRKKVGNTLVANLNVTFPVPTAGTVAIRHDRVFTRSLPVGDYWWDIVATDPSGIDHDYIEPEPIVVHDHPTDPANAVYDFVPGGGGAVYHTHSISDITGLQALLDDRLPPDGGTIARYLRGDNTWQLLNKSAVGLSLVENVTLSTWIGSSNITRLGTIVSGSWQGSRIAPAYLGDGTSIETKFLRGDGTWQTVSGGGGATAYIDLTDAASVNLPAINTPLASALAGKAATSHTHTASQISDSTATGRSILTAANQAAARSSGLGSGATGDELFRALTPAAARTTLGTLSAIATGTTAAASTTTDVVAITIPGAGFWGIEVLATFENAGSSSTLFSVVFDAAAEIPATAFRIGTVQVSTSVGALSVLLPSRVATLGTTVSSAGLFNASARGLIRTTGASVVTLRIANTVASGTTTAIQSALIATQL